MSNNSTYTKTLKIIANEERAIDTRSSRCSAQIMDLLRQGHNGELAKGSRIARKLFAVLPRGSKG